MIWDEARRQLLRQALERWRGTPHHNRLCERGVGVDCIRLVHAVLEETGVVPGASFGGYDTTAGMWKESSALQEMILKCVRGDWIPAPGPWEFGDVVVLTTGRRSAHCGIIVGDKVWHSLSGRCVTESDLVLWHKELAGAVRLRELGFLVRPEQATLPSR